MAAKKDRSADARGRVRLDDVADQAGVSIGTVSNVLNHPDRVAPATHARVMAAIDALGFTPNGMASSLARGATRTVGMVVIDISNSLYVDMAMGAQREAHAHGYYLQLAASDDDHALFDAHLRELNASRVAGVLAAPLDDRREALDQFRRQGSAVVLLNYDMPNYDACRVLVDNEMAGYLAARHLIDLGRTRIAFLFGREELQPVALRRQGVHRAIEESKGAVQLDEYRSKTIWPESGFAIGRKLVALPKKRRPDAVLAVTDLLAMAVINEFVAKGIQVPQDIAVSGLDHNSSAWGGAIPLTSVSMEGTTMGTEGLRLLLAEIEEDPDVHVHRTILLQPHLVPRESTIGRQV
ncbi:LacI family DNA-binding transcriptional regulator [Microbacterium sp. X-17]|uniref:LacI family DNA-binding transcriptional regulator n=1 Tax=Microbacterium sp. X-17 TaxID=3144404 RepID=UPI0031F5624C